MTNRNPSLRDQHELSECLVQDWVTQTIPKYVLFFVHFFLFLLFTGSFPIILIIKNVFEFIFSDLRRGSISKYVRICSETDPGSVADIRRCVELVCSLYNFGLGTV